MASKRLSRAESQVLAKQVVHYYENEGNRDINTIVVHFRGLPYNVNTVKGILQRWRHEGRVGHKKNKGQPKSEKRLEVTPEVKRDLIRKQMSEPQIA